MKFYIEGLALLALAVSFSSCVKQGKDKDKETVADVIVEAVNTDTISVDSLRVEQPKVLPPLDTKSQILAYMRSAPDSTKYMSGVLPKVLEASEDYARRLLTSEYDKFIIVDKNKMTVTLYDSYGDTIKQYGTACAKNYGTKHQKADSRTPEGFFSVQGIYDSTDWLFTDDDGVTSKVKGQFGPRFIRLKIPKTSQIGIHGTVAPWSIGHRVSHGCIRVTNENILELVELVDSGMPVIINPGARDVAVNEMEDCEVPWIDTDGKMKSKIKWWHRQLEEEARKQQAIRDSIGADSLKSVVDSISLRPIDAVAPTDSIAL